VSGTGAGAPATTLRPGAYAVRIGVTVAFFVGTCAAIVWVGDSWYQLVIAAVLGVAFTQVAFLAHDGGHQQIFTRRRSNDRFGQAAGLLTGLSYGWWLGKHNRHHANPNKEDHDPDIGDGVLAFTTGQVAARTGRLGRATPAGSQGAGVRGDPPGRVRAVHGLLVRPQPQGHAHRSPPMRTSTTCDARS